MSATSRNLSKCGNVPLTAQHFHTAANSQVISNGVLIWQVKAAVHGKWPMRISPPR